MNEIEKKAKERARQLCRTHVLFPDWRKDDTGIPLVCPNCDDITAALLNEAYNQARQRSIALEALSSHEWPAKKEG